MTKNLVLMHELLQKHKFVSPIPAAIQDHVLKSRKKILIQILKSMKQYHLLDGVILAIFFFAKKIGIKLTIYQSAAVLGLLSLLSAVVVSSSVYTGITYIAKAQRSVPLAGSPVQGQLDESNAQERASVDQEQVKTSVAPASLVWDGDYVVANKQDIRSLEGYSRITGELVVSGSSLVTLKGLERIQSVGGMTVGGNRRLERLEGLQGLSYVSGSVKIFKNSRLSSLDGLKNLSVIEKDLEVNNNPALARLDGLEHIASLKNCVLSQNDQLSSLHGLQNLNNIAGNFVISDNTSLMSLEGLKALRAVGNLEVTKNANIKNFDGLDQLQAVARNVMIFNNQSLETLTGLKLLQSVKGSLKIWGNPVLEEFYAFDSLTSCGEVNIANNPKLQALDELSGLTFVRGSFSLWNNASLKTLKGLENIALIGGDLEFLRNNSLTTLEGLENVSSVGGNLRIHGNKQLKSLHGLFGITEIGGELSVVQNAYLETLYGLNNVVLVQGNVMIRQNNNLQKLDLYKLKHVYGSLRVTQNRQLPDYIVENLVGGLQNFKGVLQISDNKHE